MNPTYTDPDSGQRMASHMCVAILLAMSLGPWLRADDQAEMLAVIEKAVKAQGGEEKLSKIGALTIRMKGKTNGAGISLDVDQSVFMQFPDKRRVDVVINEESQSVVTVGDKAWEVLDGKWHELAEEKLTDVRERLYADQVMRLLDLKDKAYQFTPAGEVKVGDDVTTRVKVTRKDHIDVLLYFDNKTFLLKRGEWTTTHGSFVAVTLQDYRDVDGVKFSHKKTETFDRVTVELDVIQIKVLDKLDDKIFSKP